MSLINLYDAKAQLSKLVDRAAAGEDVVIGKSGRPLARLTRIEQEKRPIRFGVLKGKVK